jgi:hypothetical protein
MNTNQKHMVQKWAILFTTALLLAGCLGQDQHDPVCQAALDHINQCLGAKVSAPAQVCSDALQAKAERVLAASCDTLSRVLTQEVDFEDDENGDGSWIDWSWNDDLENEDAYSDEEYDTGEEDITPDDEDQEGPESWDSLFDEFDDALDEADEADDKTDPLETQDAEENSDATEDDSITVIAPSAAEAEEFIMMASSEGSSDSALVGYNDPLNWQVSAPKSSSGGLPPEVCSRLGLSSSLCSSVDSMIQKYGGSGGGEQLKRDLSKLVVTPIDGQGKIRKAIDDYQITPNVDVNISEKRIELGITLSF